MPRAPRADAVLKQQLSRWQTDARPQRCIAISRLPGAAGEEVAALVAQRLGFGLFGREILEEIAREHGVEQELLADLDESVRSTVSRSVRDLLAAHPFTESDYLRAVGRVVATLAERGQAVIVGRGAAHLLPPEQALRVLLFAPRAWREDRLAGERGLAPAAAVGALREEEEHRAEFVRHHFGVRLDDPTPFDLALNVATLGTDRAATAVIDVLRLRFPAG